MGAKQWRCFHCDEVFTHERWAREHFGASQMQTAACQIKGSEGHLLAALRKAEDQLASYRAEDNDLMRAYHGIQAEKVEAERRAEEKGYERGVRDMKAQGLCVEPAKHAEALANV